MLPFTPLLRALLLFVIATSTILYFSVYSRESVLRTPTPELDQHVPAKGIDKKSFIQAILDNEIDGKFDPKPIQKVCASKKWNPDLIFICGTPQGGIGNVRNVVLTCVRYAIEAGASVVVPRIAARDETDLSHVATDDIVPFDYFFNTTHFIHSLREACPQMTVHPSVPKNITHGPINLKPQSLLNATFAGTVLSHAEQWRPAFNTWLSKQNSTNNPTVVELATSFLNFPLKYDTEEFGNTFGRLLQFREPARRLAATALYVLRTQYKLPIAPKGISSGTFLGTHLRAATEAGSTTYGAQTSFFFALAAETDLAAIYVTSESKPAEVFKADAAAHKITVVTKQDLLAGADLEELQSMSWDQQSLVDYEVLLRSSLFAGIDKSSFAWNVALRRHVLSGKRGSEAWDKVKAGESLDMKDEYSRLLGKKGGFPMYVEGMWP